jgi:uncharacterized protein with HEPN domain
MNKRNRVILQKIIEESTTLAKMLDGVDESAFLANEEKMRATCMTLINIGELVKNLTDDFRQNNQLIPWKDIAGLRDVTAHGYFTLRMPDIWIFTTTELPVYAESIRKILTGEGEKQL